MKHLYLSGTILQTSTHVFLCILGTLWLKIIQYKLGGPEEYIFCRYRVTQIGNTLLKMRFLVKKIKTQGNLSSEYSNAVTPPNIKHLLAFVSKLKDYLSIPSQEALWFLMQIDTWSRTLSSSPQAWASLNTQREPGLGWPLRL